jgi:hypothetical protein
VRDRNNITLTVAYMQHIKNIVFNKSTQFGSYRRFGQKVFVNYYHCFPLKYTPNYITVPEHLWLEGVLIQVNNDSPIWLDQNIQPRQGFRFGPFHDDNYDKNYFLLHFFYNGILHSKEVNLLCTEQLKPNL